MLRQKSKEILDLYVQMHLRIKTMDALQNAVYLLLEIMETLKEILHDIDRDISKNKTLDAV